MAQIAASIREWGWTIPVLVDEEGGIIAGHGRVLAAMRLGIAEVPVMTARGWTEAQRRAYVLADNKLALNAGWDEDLMRVELSDLQAGGFDLGLAGFGAADLEELSASGNAALSENYSRKIEAPIYRPGPEKPAASDLYDDSKANALDAEIKEAGLPSDVATFLSLSAQRHTVFDFAKIANFYAHSEPDVQRLMERSALVIIDFDKAIENGFVKVTEALGDLAAQAEAADA